MNKKQIFLFTCSFFLMTIVAMAQSAPEAFKYQAVARNIGGQIMDNQPVNFQISILEGNISGNSVYTETHNALTNSFGLVNLEIGNGAGIIGDFSTIDWGGSSFFLQIEMDASGGTDFQLMGTSQLMSVPYAIHAKTAESVAGDTDGDPANELQELSITDHELTLSNGNTISLPDDVNDADSNPNNEIELPVGGSNGQVLATDGAGNYSWIDNEEGASTYAIGDLAHGGIVFYVNPEGTHGLVAANVDQHDYETWYDVHDLLNDPSNHDAEGLKYFDWRLPSRWESTKMYENLKAQGLGDFDNFGYWIGVEFSTDKAYCEDFIVGGQLEVDKTTHFLHVRAVRTF
ncbi:MAG: hypothetical protein ACI8YQ_002942 [Polaribacter sp.]|jgi:hypothetical protein